MRKKRMLFRVPAQSHKRGSDLGFEAIDLGGLEYARLIESLAMIWIHLAVFKGQGVDFAFGLLRK